MKLFIILFVCPWRLLFHENETFEDFYASDVKYPEELRVRDSIKEIFSIGKFKGFVGEFSKKALERLSKCPYVSEITPDIQVHALETAVQKDSPRHLARISQRKKLKKKLKYYYDDEFQGKGVNAYIIDSGLEVGHPEFEGRAMYGQDFTNQGTGDTNGHGTHVAGIVGSSTYGVSKKVELIEVKALSAEGSGSLSTIIAALEYATKHRRKTNVPGVANLSLGATKNTILNKAIDAAFDDGLVIVVAAGNSNINACRTSPGSAINAITVGSIDDRTDSLAGFSNWGECVDILASGSMVQSVDFKSPAKPKILSGTSMSAPIVTGIVANMLSSGVGVEEVKKRLVESATEGKVRKTSMLLKGKTPNRIAYLEVEYESEYDTDYESDE